MVILPSDGCISNTTGMVNSKHVVEYIYHSMHSSHQWNLVKLCQKHFTMTCPFLLHRIYACSDVISIETFVHFVFMHAVM